MTYFFHRLYISSSFPWYISVLSRNRGLKRNGSFHSGSPFQLKSYACQKEKQSGSYAILLQTLRLSGREKVEVKRGRTDREGMKGVQEGRSWQVWHHLTQWVAFLCQDMESVGGREAGCFRLHSDALGHRHGHCVATRLHTSLLIVPGSR